MPKSRRNFLELAKSRKTTYEFNGRMPPAGDVRKALEAARWAPSCGNSQPWHFIVVRNKKAISSLVKAATHGAFFSPPPLLVAIAINRNMCRDSARFRLKPDDMPDAFMGVGMAAVQLALEAEELGIGSCILTPEPSASSRLLHIPKGSELAIMVGLGYGQEGGYAKTKSRRELPDSVSYEHFGGKR